MTNEQQAPAWYRRERDAEVRSVAAERDALREELGRLQLDLWVELFPLRSSEGGRSLSEMILAEVRRLKAQDSACIICADGWPVVEVPDGSRYHSLPEPAPMFKCYGKPQEPQG